MIRSILKVGLLLVVGVLVYNFFLGTPEEKEQSRKIFNKGKEVVVSVGNLVKSEKEKFDAGKYDNALDKVGNLFSGIRDKANELQDGDYLKRIDELDEKRKELQEELADIQTDENNKFTSREDEQKAEKIRIDLDGLMDRAQQLLNKMEQGQK